ncbi:MAG: glycosyltransferase family 4 protein [Actinomycetota bacterium]|nr:glycosyltransferase family 4 protein [Actinomycetota bacterium]
MSQSDPPRVGYVLKMYPRFSETFILNEILALEADGTNLDIFSLRPPSDGHFHEALAAVRASVTYLPHRVRVDELWEVLRRALQDLPRLPMHLDEVLGVPAAEATAAVQLALQVRERGIPHLHAHFGSVATTVARLAARLCDIDYSFTAHAKDIFHESVAPGDLLGKLADASAVVTVSDFNVDYLRDRYGAAAHRVVRIYNGLDLNQYSYAEPRHRPPLVVGVGRMVEKKGFGHLVDAVALLRRQRRAVRLALVGTGELQPALRAQVTMLGLTGCVEFLGPLTQARTREVVRGAAALAAPCVVAADGNRDGLPTVLLEAMALGTPCVSTPVTGIPEVIRDGETGLLVPERDPGALAGALDRLLDDPELRCRLAAAARSRVERDFDVRRSARQLRRMFGLRSDVPMEVA